MSNDRKSEFTTMAQQERKQLAGNLQKRILDSMNNSFMSPQTVAWLNNMNEDVRMTGMAGQSLDVVLDWIVIVDKLFDEFQRYSFQYNQNEPTASFITSVRRPTQCGTNAQKYEGFVFNSKIAMLVTVEPKSITLSIIAPRFVYEQQEYREPTTPFLTFLVEETAKGELWKMDGMALAYSQLPMIAKKIFARFIRVTRGECGEAEPLKIDDKSSDNQTQSGEHQAIHQTSRLDVITESILQILENVDAEIMAIEAEGIASVKAKDLQKSEFLLKRSQALRTFRQKSAETAQQWASVFLSEE